MFMKADVVQDEVDAPLNMWCDSGHRAPKMFRRSGPKSDLEPTRFFLVTSKNIYGIYCEQCLMVAHHIAKKEKERLG